MTDPAQTQEEDMQASDTSAENNAAEETSNIEDLGSAMIIADLEKKLAEANDKMLRAMAEAENTRRRLEKERIDTSKFAVSSFAKDMLAVADNLRRALDAITPEQREKIPELKSIYVGVEATERVLATIFERNNIKKVDPANQMFDPNLHEVIFEGHAPDKAPGTIIQVVEQGYTLHDRLLRPARVGVAKGGVEPASSLDEQV